MTDHQRDCITRLRHTGKSYGSIARELGLSANTIKSFCQRKDIKPRSDHQKDFDNNFCVQCEQPITQPENRKPKRFCSDKCRSRWWNEHRQELSRKSAIIRTCAHCGIPFESYPQEQRKYCCHACYIQARFRGHRP